MTISIAFGSRGHAYSLACYAQGQGILHRIYTFYPRRYIDPKLHRHARSFPWLAGGLMALSRLGMGKSAARLNNAANRGFSRWIATIMEPADIFMAMSGLGLQARRAAKKMGAFTVCDRGSTHIRYQNDLLEDEHQRWGVPYHPISPTLMDYEDTEYAEADLIVAQSSFAHRSFLSRGTPPGKVTWVSLATDTETFYPSVKQDDLFRVLFLGQIGFRKGFQYLLQAADLLKNTPCEIVFAGTLQPEAVDLMRRYEKRVRYVGSPRTKADLQQLYSQASVFVLPSIEDGFGLVITEAMACGIPVIATTNTGAPDVIEEGREGFIVPIRSPEALADRIASLQAHPKRLVEMGQEALKKARTNDWNAYGRRVVTMYEQSLAGRGLHEPNAAHTDCPRMATTQE